MNRTANNDGDLVAPGFYSLWLDGRFAGRLALMRKRFVEHDGALAVANERLSDPELTYLKTLKSASRRSEFMGGRLLLRSLLTQSLGEDATSVSVSAGEGAPAFSGLPDNSAVRTAAISHSPNWLAALVSASVSAALDLEQERPGHAVEKTARYLGWDHLIEGRESRDFWRLWTLWEATAKAVGGSVMTRDNAPFHALAPSLLKCNQARADGCVALSRCLLEEQAPSTHAQRTHVTVVLGADPAIFQPTAAVMSGLELKAESPDSKDFLFASL